MRGGSRAMGTLKIAELLVLAISALVTVAKSIIKFLGYIYKITAEQQMAAT
jgi:hypothetical protein